MVPQLSSQYLALACQRLADFEDEALKAPKTQGIAPVARMLQVGWAIYVTYRICFHAVNGHIHETYLRIKGAAA